MTAPTQAQIDAARNNLAILRELNQEAAEHHTLKIVNAYALLVGESDTADPGLPFVLGVFENVFSYLSGEAFGPAGKAAATLFGGMIAGWIDNTPPSLAGAFASYATRYDATWRELNHQLDSLNDQLGSKDPATVEKAWNTQIQFNGQTSTVSALSSSGLPSKVDSNRFDDMVDGVVFSQDQSLWRSMLQEHYEALYYTWYHRGQGEDGNYETLPLEWARYRMGYYPYVFYCYYDYQGGYEPPFHFICANEYVVCRKGTNNWYYLNDDACRYLFIDSTPNSVINADGLFHREAVMNFLGIKHVETVRYCTTDNPFDWREPPRAARPDAAPQAAAA
ncbi:hypothetical protein ABIE09_003395 [Lysobacter enzymogenes]|uniref:hypothetical protein n=1 Tax=Lysobacter enzymogenes TaxID=69 RepID=UPI0033975C15